MRNWASGNKSRAASHQLLFPVIAAIIFAFWHARCGLANRPRNARPGREVFPASVSERLGKNSRAHRPQQRGVGAVQVAVWPVTIE